jgi:peptide chain release factor 3
VLFKGDWQLETCAKAFPKTRFVELGNAAVRPPD